MIQTPKFLIPIIIIFGVLTPAQGSAQSSLTSENDGKAALGNRQGAESTEELEVVLRFSKGLFESLTQQDVEMTIPINRSVDEIKVTGQADGKGKTNITLNESSNVAEFIIRVPGTVDVEFSGDAGIATAHATSDVCFNTAKRIVFDGEEFFQSKTETQSKSRTCVNQICPRRNGPIGRVVKRAGWCVVRKNISEINKMVEEVADEILADTFDKRATELLKSLNEINQELNGTRFQSTIKMYFPEIQSFTYQFKTESDSILAGVGVSNERFPDLPAPKAHVELWLKTRPVEASFLEMLVEWNVAHDLLKEFLPEDEAKLISEDLKVETIDGWSVLRIGHETLLVEDQE